MFTVKNNQVLVICCFSMNIMILIDFRLVQYVGEVITSDEAESRGKKYDADGRTYLFDLDFNLGDDNLYTVPT